MVNSSTTNNNNNNNNNNNENNNDKTCTDHSYKINANTTIITIMTIIDPVPITRFPLSRFSPGSGLLRNPFVP